MVVMSHEKGGVNLKALKKFIDPVLLKYFWFPLGGAYSRTESLQIHLSTTYRIAYCST